MPNTLLLNADGQPLNMMPLSTLTWKDAIQLVWSEDAIVLASYEDWIVRSPSISLKVPSIIILKSYVSVGRSVKFTRGNVYLRDNFVCQYCGVSFKDSVVIQRQGALITAPRLTFDHVKPRSKGGKTNWLNITTACSECNLEKAHYTDMKPINKPHKPDYHQLVSVRRSLPIYVPDERWVDYIGWDQSKLHVIKRSQ